MANSIEAIMTDRVAKAVISKIDIDALATALAPVVVKAVENNIKRDIANWDFGELLYEAIDNNKALTKMLSAKITEAFTTKAPR